MRKLALILLAAASLISSTGCKDSPTAPDVKTFVGTWNATKAEFVSVANSSIKDNIIAHGSTLTLVFTASALVQTITDPGENPEVANGTWSVSSDTLTITWTSGFFGESQFDFSLNGDQLTLTGGHQPHDFTLGNPEEAILNLILVRQ